MPNGCGCIHILLYGSGGAQLNGSATIQQVPERHWIEPSGGVAIAGKSPVYIPGEDFGTNMSIWPLQEVASGFANEYEDIINDLHGTGKGTVPDRISGPFCLYAQDFKGDSYIQLPDDNVSRDFAVSFWVNRQDFYKQRALFSRGHGKNTWVFLLSYSVMGHLLARFNMTDGTDFTSHTAYSVDTLDQDRWYHVAAQWERATGTAEIYINGNLNNSDDSTYEPPNYELVETTNTGAIAGFQSAGSPDAYMLDVRLHPVIRTAEYWKAEYDNYCDGSFYSVSNQQTSVAPF